MTFEIKTMVNGVITTPFALHTFLVDKEADWLKMSFSFSKNGWTLLLIWDTEEKLRLQYLYINEDQNRSAVIANDPDLSSFSTVPGKIPAGEWKIEMYSETYQSSPNFDIEIEYGNHVNSLPMENRRLYNWVTVSKNGSFELSIDHFREVYKNEPGWYKGDFHTHTNISDGMLTPQQGMEQAIKRGLDFFVATDHNIIPTKWVQDEVLVIPGIEVTSAKGHFNALGLKSWIDWRPTCRDGGMETEEGMNRVLRDVKEAGALRSINHPMLEPWEWAFSETDLAEIDVIEIWNDPTYKDNPQATEEALKLWDILLNDGHRIYGIGGSDSHMLPTESYEKGGPPSVIGDPATYVYAENLSAESILQSVSRGKVYVSRGPVIDIGIHIGEEKVELGSDVTEIFKKTSTDQIEYHLTYTHVPEEAEILWIINGEIKKSHDLLTSGAITAVFDLVNEDFVWNRFEIRKKDGELLAFSNPIFKGKKETSVKHGGNYWRK